MTTSFYNINIISIFISFRFLLDISMLLKRPTRSDSQSRGSFEEDMNSKLAESRFDEDFFKELRHSFFLRHMIIGRYLWLMNNQNNRDFSKVIIVDMDRTYDEARFNEADFESGKCFVNTIATFTFDSPVNRDQNLDGH